MKDLHIGLSAASTALREVVASVIPKEERKAHEQLRLSIEYIDFIERRIEFVFNKAQLETDLHLRMLQEIVDELPDDFALRGEALRASEVAFQDRHEAMVTTKRLQTNLTEVLSVITDVIRAASDNDDLYSRVQAVVLRYSTMLVEFERAWYQPLGMDADPETLGAVEELLAGGLESLAKS